MSREWTNYSACLDVKSLLKNDYHIATIVAYSISICSHIPVFIIFGCYRFVAQYRKPTRKNQLPISRSELRDTRVKLHIVLLFAIFATAVLSLVHQLYFIDGSIMHQNFNEQYESTIEASRAETGDGTRVVAGGGAAAWSPYLALCKVNFSLLQYFRLASLTCMLSEAIRLARVVASSSAAFSMDNESVMPYVFVSFGFPAVVIASFALLKYFFADSQCWIEPDWYYWIIVVPSLLIIFVNGALLLVIIREVVNKVKATNSSELTQFK